MHKQDGSLVPHSDLDNMPLYRATKWMYEKFLMPDNNDLQERATGHFLTFPEDVFFILKYLI